MVLKTVEKFYSINKEINLKLVKHLGLELCSKKTLLEKTAVGGPTKQSESACISLHFTAENVNTFCMVWCFADKNTLTTYVVSN